MKKFQDPAGIQTRTTSQWNWFNLASYLATLRRWWKSSAFISGSSLRISTKLSSRLWRKRRGERKRKMKRRGVLTLSSYT